MTTIFSKIIAREIPAQFVYEDNICVVVMDKFPAVQGQTLIVPKLEMDYAFDLPDEIYQHIFSIAKKIAKASDTTYNTARTCLVVEGFEVPHVHIKLYPMLHTDKNLSQVILEQSEKTDEELQIEANKIKSVLTDLI